MIFYRAVPRTAHSGWPVFAQSDGRRKLWKRLVSQEINFQCPRINTYQLGRRPSRTFFLQPTGLLRVHSAMLIFPMLGISTAFKFPFRKAFMREKTFNQKWFHGGLAFRSWTRE